MIHHRTCLPQSFIPRRNGRLCLFLAKVVDVLITGRREQSSDFYKQISNRFKVVSIPKQECQI